MGLQARLMSQALRKLTAATAKNGTALVFIKQLRQKNLGAKESPSSHRWRAARLESGYLTAFAVWPELVHRSDIEGGLFRFS